MIKLLRSYEPYLRRLLSVLALAAMCFSPSLASAESKRRSFELILGAQYILAKEGFYDDKLDGKAGPKTQAALAEYARKNNIDNELETIVRRMWLMSVPLAQGWTPDIEHAIMEKLETYFLDARSARFKDKRLYTGPSGTRMSACVDITAKNSYGAYVGYQTLLIGLSSIGNHYVVHSPIADASDLCRFGFVVGEYEAGF